MKESGRPFDDYHAALVTHGVRGYDRAPLDEDYRLSALCQITIPVRQRAYGIPAQVWSHYLAR